MKIISIDPGYDRLGVAIIEKENYSRERVIFSKCIQTNRQKEISNRLFSIKKEIEKIINKFQPEVMIMEELYFNINQKTVIAVAETKGVLKALGEENKMKIFEINPLKVKVAITGYGRSQKKEVANMVKKLVNIKDKKMLDDEIDAIAIGIAFLAEYRK